jgi:hypothetical protein
MGRELFEIATALIGVALVALLVSHYSGTVSIIQAGTSGFAGLLSTVENPESSGGFGSFGIGSVGTF